MPVTRIEQLVELRQQIADEYEAFTAKDDFDPNSPALAELVERAESTDAMIARLQQAAELRAGADKVSRAVARVPEQLTTGDPGNIGRAIVDGQPFQMWKRSGMTGRAKLAEMPVNLRAPLTTATFASAPQQVVAAPPAFQNPLLSALTSIMVATGSVEIISYPSSGDPNANVVAEGAIKPEGAPTVSIDTVTLDTIAVWVEMTRQLAEDETRFVDFVQATLIRGVYDKAEAEAAAVVEGGTGYHEVTTPETMLEGIRVGIAEVTAAGYRPNGVLMNPLDAASLDFSIWEATNGGANGGTVWGAPVIPVGAITAGTSYVADFGAAFHHYYRGSADIYITDSDVSAVDNTSNFKKNILTTLAEMRAKTAVIRPEAVAKVTPTPPVAAFGASSKKASK